MLPVLPPLFIERFPRGEEPQKGPEPIVGDTELVIELQALEDVGPHRRQVDRDVLVGEIHLLDHALQSLAVKIQIHFTFLVEAFFRRLHRP